MRYTKTVRVNGTNGNKVYSDKFNGLCKEIPSYLLYYLSWRWSSQLTDQPDNTLDVQIVHGHGVACGEFFKVRVLGYVDDAVMLDRDTQALTIRLTTLVDAAKKRDRYGSFDAQDLASHRSEISKIATLELILPHCKVNCILKSTLQSILWGSAFARSIKNDTQNY